MFEGTTDGLETQAKVHHHRARSTKWRLHSRPPRWGGSSHHNIICYNEVLALLTKVQHTLRGCASLPS